MRLYQLFVQVECRRWKPECGIHWLKWSSSETPLLVKNPIFKMSLTYYILFIRFVLFFFNSELTKEQTKRFVYIFITIRVGAVVWNKFKKYLLGNDGVLGRLNWDLDSDWGRGGGAWKWLCKLELQAGQQAAALCTQGGSRARQESWLQSGPPRLSNTSLPTEWRPVVSDKHLIVGLFSPHYSQLQQIYMCKRQICLTTNEYIVKWS